MSEIEVTVVTPPMEVPEIPPALEPSISSSDAPEISDILSTEDELIQQQLDEVEQWRNDLMNNQSTLREAVTAQGEALSGMAAQLSEMAGALGTLLTLALPSPPSEEAALPEAESPAPESPVQPELEPEPEPPARSLKGRQWM